MRASRTETDTAPGCGRHGTSAFVVSRDAHGAERSLDLGSVTVVGHHGSAEDATSAGAGKPPP